MDINNTADHSELVSDTFANAWLGLGLGDREERGIWALRLWARVYVTSCKQIGVLCSLVLGYSRLEDAVFR